MAYSSALAMPEPLAQEQLPALQVSQLRKTFLGGKITAVDGISFEVHQGEVVSILGPSGCGKTTTLRIIVGLEEPDFGQIEVGGRSVIGVSPHRRNVGLMFQDLALFPHKTVGANVAFGLRMRQMSRNEIRARVSEILNVVELPSAEFADRYPAELSGGQRQRVALARTLVVQPTIVLFDEPLSALDRRLRDRMAVELRRLQKNLGVTSVYVTHDQETASMMSDRLIVMDKGRIVQSGTPRDVYDRPSSKFVADFIGDMNLFAADVQSVENGTAIVNLFGQRVRTANDAAHAGCEVVIAVRPEHLGLTFQRNERCLCEVKVLDRHFSGGIFTYRVALPDGTAALIRTMSAAYAQVDALWLEADPQRLHILEIKTR
jgi:ABC-type Fe3+/spermidine/putrescine transport system ATPase subunit